MSEKIQLDEAALKNTLESILAEIDETDDPQELNAYRAIFRKYIPLFRRAYVAAYLLSRLKPNMVRSTPRRRPVPINTNGSAPQTAASPITNTLAPTSDDVTSVFIGIGKSRKVFPRDIMGLLIEQGGLEKAHIGAIKILDNYSFVEIANAKCNDLINKLNNTEFRGRTLAVNFAKKRD
jgi:hypothetical protein